MAEPADPALVAQVLDEVERLLALNDTRAEPLVSDSAALLRSALGENYNKFRQQVDYFDYEAALTLLQATRGLMPWAKPNRPADAAMEDLQNATNKTWH